ncbi:MAG TPA: hypothetical protein VLF62_00305 [Candidatus Saccharimonadales bacterium]|nr:hypothetical protein [Candidatus Saccharimonadales bacterium]
MRITRDHFPRLSTLPPEEQELLEVVTDEFRTTDGGVLVSEFAETNILLVAHNEVTKRGLVGQFGDMAASLSHPDMPATGLHAFEMAVPALQELGPTGRTHIWLGGAALGGSYGEHPRSHQERRYAFQRVVEAIPAPAALDSDWTIQGHDYTHVRLDAEAGVLSIEFGSLSGPAGRGEMPSGPTPAA